MLHLCSMVVYPNIWPLNLTRHENGTNKPLYELETTRREHFGND